MRTTTKSQMLIVVGVLLLGVASIGAFSGCTVVTTAEATAIAQGGAFDAKSFVESKWPDVKASILGSDVSLATVLSAIQTDAAGAATKDNLKAVAEQHGLTTVGEAHVFMVQGSGTVTAVDTESRTGTMDVAVDGYSGPIKVKILTGPRIPSDETSVRDAVGYIQFGDFKEQTEFGKVARELNKRVTAEVLEKIDAANMQGKNVTFSGAFTIRTFNEPGDINMSEITVVPVRLETGG